MPGAEFLQTAVNLYYRPVILDRDIAALRDDGYHIVDVDAADWADETARHQDLVKAFNFPAQWARFGMPGQRGGR